MEVITKYRAHDGVEFYDHDECAKHEQNCTIAEGIMSRLPAKPSGCDFTNGSGFIQHEKDQLLEVRNAFLEFAKRYSDIKHIQQTIDLGFDAHPSWAGRVISECAPLSISRHWDRFSCIDSQFREWGQPYFANNPQDAEQVRLNS